MKLLIVNFHYIRDEIYKSGIYPRSLRQLSNQIDVLSKGYKFISQNDLADKILNHNFDDGNYCLISFDDGLKEQMDALDLLLRKGVPAAFYVTTNPIKNHKVVDVHKLHYIRSQIDDGKLFDMLDEMIDLSEISYPENIDSLYRYDPIETKKIKYLLNFILKPEKKQQVVDGIFDKLKDESEYSKELYMTVNDISKLSDLGYLGTHSDLHLPLATLEDDLVKKDIQNSISFLQDECGAKEIKSISYPYGGPKAVSTKVAEIAASFGFTYGLTMFRGINNIKDFDNPLMLKRVDTNDAPGGKSNNSEFCL